MHSRLSHCLSFLLADESRAGAFALILFCFTPVTVAQSPNADISGFEFKELNEASIAILDSGKPVLVYNHGDIPFQQGRRIRNRSSYVHPIYGLDGEILTDDYPADHYHHHGLFWCWPHVKVGDRRYDFWERDDVDINFQRWLSRHSDTNLAKLGIENGWFVDGRQIMKEQVWFSVHPVVDAGRSIDVTLQWTPLDETVALAGAEGKSYGGLSLRFAPRKNTIITVPSGRASEDLLITRLPWTDLSAQFADARNPSGAALFVKPDHPDFPPEWMTRDYGLLAVGWPGVNEKPISAGETVTCHYRIWIHRGRPTADEIQATYEAYRSIAQ